MVYPVRKKSKATGKLLEEVSMVIKRDKEKRVPPLLNVSLYLHVIPGTVATILYHVEEKSHHNKNNRETR